MRLEYGKVKTKGIEEYRDLMPSVTKFKMSTREAEIERVLERISEGKIARVLTKMACGSEEGVC